MIKLENVKKKTNNIEVINDISLNISEGDFYVLFCKKGGGKTTLVKMISKILPVDSGKVIYDNITKKDIAIVYDDTENDTNFTCNEYLTFYGMCYGLSINEINNRINYYLLKYNLSNIKFYQFDKLNRSKKKIIYILTALIAGRKIVIFDEIYKHIFDEDFLIVKNILKDLKNEKTVIAMTEDLNNFIDIATKIAIMENGSIIIDGDTKDSIKKFGYKNYLEIGYAGDIETITKLLTDIEYIKEYTYTESVIDVITNDYNHDHEILKKLIDNNINISYFKREDKK